MAVRSWGFHLKLVLLVLWLYRNLPSMVGPSSISCLLQALLKSGGVILYC